MIIGNPSKGSQKYYEKLRKIASSNIYFIEHLPRNELLQVIKKARGHIQPSYIETPGLVSLEATALGCKI
ncbi:hypothetical protein D3C77_695190 [compost metagenome]